MTFPPRWLCLLGMLSAASAFLPSPIPRSLAGTELLSCLTRQNPELTWTHRNITIEAVKRTVTRRMAALAADRLAEYFVDGSDTLVNVFLKLHGYNSSGAALEFSRQAERLADWVALADTGPTGVDPRYHFDAEQLQQSQKLLQVRHQRLVTSLLAGQLGSSLQQLALSLQAVQDFCSHTSWLDLDRPYGDINYALGIPGQELGAVAGENDVVCKACSSADGTCTDNVIRNGRLTSGYISGQYINGAIVSKPLNRGKCSHGGLTDLSRSEPAVGGINKDAFDACFSPHHDMHERAAQCAIESSATYLSSVLAAVGEERADWFLRSGPRQCLVLVLDVSEGMEPELAAVKQQAAQLAQLPENLTPACYILVTFSAQGVTPALVTSDLDALRRQLDRLLPTAPGPRPGVGALLAAAAAASDGSDIYLVTDRAPTDTERHLQLLRRLADSGTRVNLILSGGSFFRSGLIPASAAGRPRDFGPSLLERPADVESVRPLPLQSDAAGGESNPRSAEQRVVFSDALSPLQVYSNVSRASGGLVVEVSKAAAAQALQLLQLAANNSKATLLQAYDVGVPGFSVMFGVDQTVSQLEVTLTGQVETALLTSPRGARIDLRSPSGRPDALGSEVGRLHVVLNSEQLRVVWLDEPARGDWRLELTSRDSYYLAHVTVRAVSYLDIRASVVTLADREVTHPGMQVSRGRLVTGGPGSSERNALPHLLLQIISTDDQPFRDVTDVFVTSLSGDVIAQIPYNLGAQWSLYLPLNPIWLSQPANIRVVGLTDDGSRWMRQAPLLTTTSSVTLELLRPEVDAVRPGQTGDVTFRLTNQRPIQRSFDLSGSDTLGYLHSVEPERLDLPPGGSRIVTARYYVPAVARPGDTSMLSVSVLANGLEDGTAVYQTITVLGQSEDVSAPTCTLQRDAYGRCDDNLDEDNCADLLWSVDVSIADNGAGIHEVHVFPSGRGRLSTESFVEGTQQVVATYQSSCCHPNANITAVDRLGNAGTCVIHLGDVEYGSSALLGSAGLGLVIAAAVLLLLLIVLALVTVALRRRRAKSRDLPTLEEQRRRERHTPVAEESAAASSQM